MRFFLYRTGRKPFYFLPILLVCHILACGDKAVDPQENLNTMSHEHVDLYWEGTPIKADVTWRFISAEEGFNNKIFITGSWIITFRNTGVNTYGINIGQFVFEDPSGFQITEYTPISNAPIDIFSIAGSQTSRRTGNFEILVNSVDIANTITYMGVYAVITQL